MIAVFTVTICILVLAVVDSGERLETSSKYFNKTAMGMNVMLFDRLVAAERQRQVK